MSADKYVHLLYLNEMSDYTFFYLDKTVVETISCLYYTGRCSSAEIRSQLVALLKAVHESPGAAFYALAIEELCFDYGKNKSVPKRRYMYKTALRDMLRMDDSDFFSLESHSVPSVPKKLPLKTYLSVFDCNLTDAILDLTEDFMGTGFLYYYLCVLKARELYADSKMTPEQKFKDFHDYLQNAVGTVSSDLLAVAKWLFFNTGNDCMNIQRIVRVGDPLDFYTVFATSVDLFQYRMFEKMISDIQKDYKVKSGGVFVTMNYNLFALLKDSGPIQYFPDFKGCEKQIQSEIIKLERRLFL